MHNLIKSGAIASAWALVIVAITGFGIGIIYGNLYVGLLSTKYLIACFAVIGALSILMKFGIRPAISFLMMYFLLGVGYLILLNNLILYHGRHVIF